MVLQLCVKFTDNGLLATLEELELVGGGATAVFL